MVVPSIARHVPHFNMPNTCRMRNIRNASLSAGIFAFAHIIFVHNLEGFQLGRILRQTDLQCTKRLCDGYVNAWHRNTPLCQPPTCTHVYPCTERNFGNFVSDYRKENVYGNCCPA